MRVNFPFTSFVTNRLALRSCGVILLVAIFSIASSFRDPSDRSLLEKEVNIIIRQIGHRLLLQAGDSTSRVMPVTEIREGTFVLRFEKKFNFNHDSLQLLSMSLLSKAKFPSGYTVTVHDCRKGDIIYGFQVNNTTPDILPCLGRSQPRGCYTMEFTFPDLYENTDPKKPATDQGKNTSKVSKTDEPGTKAGPDKLNLSTSNNGTDLQTKGSSSAKPGSSGSNSKSSGFKTASINHRLNNLVYAGLLGLLVTIVLIWNFRKTSKKESIQNQAPGFEKQSISELPSLGKFLFNVKEKRLIFGEEVISLTDKECKVLELLHRNFGELIPRETLMQEIWINEGVITGRSLDMFISKLRKKINPDPQLRITNVHGKGYRLEIAFSA